MTLTKVETSTIFFSEKMTLQQELSPSIAAPGFAGFVPSLKYQFGQTYGNATRHILRTDPCLKKGNQPIFII